MERRWKHQDQTKYCQTCGDRYVWKTQGGNVLVNGDKCIPCEVQSRVEAFKASQEGK